MHINISHKHIHKHTNISHTHTHKHFTHARTHTHRDMHTNICITHTHTCTHTQTFHTHTQTHTETPMLVCLAAHHQTNLWCVRSYSKYQTMKANDTNNDKTNSYQHTRRATYIFSYTLKIVKTTQYRKANQIWNITSPELYYLYKWHAQSSLIY